MFSPSLIVCLGEEQTVSAENPVELKSQIQENYKPLQEHKTRVDSSLSFAWNHLTC